MSTGTMELIPRDVIQSLPPREQLLGHEIGFNQFLQEIYPNTHRNIFYFVDQIVKGFEQYCKHDEDGTFAKVRGGAMRRFLFKSKHKDEHVLAFMRKLPKQYRGTDKLTQKVIDYTFPGVTDLDIRFRFMPGFSNQMEQEIYKQLLSLGFEFSLRNGEISFFNNDHIAEIERFQIGGSVQRQVRRIHFAERRSGNKVFILDLAGGPQNETEEKEDLKNSETAADIDYLAQAKLRNSQKGLILNYGSFKAYLKLAANFFNKGETQYKGFHIQSVQELIAGFRESSFRGYYLPSMFLNFRFAKQEIPNSLSLMIKVWPGLLEQLDPHAINKWIENNQSELAKQSRRLPLMSSAFFCMTSLLGLTSAYFNGYLEYTPLGRIIGDRLNYFARMMHEISKTRNTDLTEKNAYELAVQQYIIGFDPKNPQNFAPFIIIQWLKDYQLISPDLGVNLDTAVRLIDVEQYNTFPYGNLPLNVNPLAAETVAESNSA